MKKYLLAGFIIVLIGLGNMGFKNVDGWKIENPVSTDDSSYVKEIKTWHQKRIEGLKSENGWLNLAGLYWLKEGKNTFGSDRKNQIVFPKGKAAAKVGTFTLDKGEVTIEVDAQNQVTANNQPVSNLKIYPSDKNIVLQSGSLRWFVIKRANKYGIRLRDLESDVVKHFTDIETFPIDSKWRIKAKFVPATSGKTIDITDVLGNVTPQLSPGALVFKIDGKEYELDAIEEGNQLFIIFADGTTAKETYGAGRFLYTEKADSEGFVYVDFNKAINPPCAFTPYATCPLPPKQNKLAVAITAGEKNYGEH